MEQAQPDWIDLLHNCNKAPGYYRTLYHHVAENLAVNPASPPEGFHRIPVPTLLMAGEDDLWGNLDQMVQMRRNIPHAEMLIMNHAGHTSQQTHPPSRRSSCAGLFGAKGREYTRRSSAILMRLQGVQCRYTHLPTLLEGARMAFFVRHPREEAERNEERW